MTKELVYVSLRYIHSDDLSFFPFGDFYMRQTRLITLILGMISISQLSYGYLAIHETGDILPPNQYSLGLNQQIITDPGTYGTLTATASMGLTDSSQLTMRLGTGLRVSGLSCMARLVLRQWSA